MNEEPLLEFKKINKYFTGVHALKNIDFRLDRGSVHCLAGENGSGKSTLVKIASGVYTPTNGTISLHGTTYEKLNPGIAMSQGVHVIYQDLSLFEHMSLAENIAISKIHRDEKFVRKSHIMAIAEKQISKIGVDLDLHATVRESSMGNRQIAAICRALAMDAKILFMDEPTTALTRQEVDRLLDIVVDLKRSGLSIVFISHKLDEILQVSDIITVFRDGNKVGDFPAGEMTAKKLSFYMTGKDVAYPKYQNSETKRQALLQVRNLKANKLSDISLDVNKGDIVGVVGLLGSGRSEFALSLFGLNPAKSGTITLNGRECTIANAQVAKEYGIALLPEDRSTQGLFLQKTVCENISSAMIDTLAEKRGFFDWRKERKIAEEGVKSMNIKTPSIATLIENLSGGNQQKAAIAKWIRTNPTVLIMDSPTVGIDIGSKAEIYHVIQNLAGSGIGIILISDEVEEILTNCNKVVVFSNGKVSKTLSTSELHEAGIEKRLQELISLGARRKQHAEKA